MLGSRTINQKGKMKQQLNKFDEAGEVVLQLLLSAPPLFIEAVCITVVAVGYFFWPLAQICKH